MKKSRSWIYFLLGFIFIISFAILISNLGEEEQKFEEITLTYFIEELNNEDVYLYLGYPECQYCQEIEPLLIEIQKDLEQGIKYINTNKMTDEERDKLPELHDVFKDGWGTPLLLNASNGVIIEYSMGAKNIEELKKFYKLDENEDLVEINFKEFKEIISLDEEKIIFFGYPECPYCQRIKPILEDIETEEDIEIKYLNINNLTESEFGELAELSDAFQGGWGVPLIIISKGNEVLRYSSGFKEKPELLTFFEIE